MKGVLRVVGMVVIVGIIALLAYVRLAPSDPDRWHVMPPQVKNEDLVGGAMRVIPGNPEQFARLVEMIETSDGTTRLAGSIEEGMVTVVTRSVVFGFPDYTTLRLQDDEISIHARLRFGKSDLGVNAARLDAWLAQFGE